VAKISKRGKRMKTIIGLGIILLLTGCGHAISGGQVADYRAVGWHNPNKTDQEKSQDSEQCQSLCSSACNRVSCEDFCMRGRGYAWQ